MKRRGIIVAALALCLATLPSLADAAEHVWREGTSSSPFSVADQPGLVVLTDHGDPALTFRYEASTAFNGDVLMIEPRSVRAASDGSYLVAGGSKGFIYRISGRGQLLRTYSKNDIPGLQRPFDATPLSDGGMLIVDRAEKPGDFPGSPGTGFVRRLNRKLEPVWEFNTRTGPLAGKMWDPFTAEPTGEGTWLIADSLGNQVLEVDDKGNLRWSYGTYMVKGTGPNQLSLPHSAQRLKGGNTLICDSEGQRVIEVTPKRKIVWSYGIAGVPGPTNGAGLLNGPNSARRLPNGDTLICDVDNDRVIVVNKEKQIVEEYGDGSNRANGFATLGDPRAAVRLPDGSTVIADVGTYRLARFRYSTRSELVATSGLIDPAIGKMKWFSGIKMNGVRPAGSVLDVLYTVNGRDWLPVPTKGTFPKPVQGSAIRYRIRMTPGDGASAPVVNDIAIIWSDTAPVTGKAKTKKSSGSGAKQHTASPSQSSAPATRTITQSGSGKVTPAGSGSQDATTVAPGGSATIGGGTPGGSNGAGEGVTQSTTMSGWVMSEVKDESGGTAGTAGTGGFGSGSDMQTSTSPGIALLAVAYCVGLAWSPASRLALRAVITAMTH